MRTTFRRDVSAFLLLAVSATGCLNEKLIKVPELPVIPGLPAGWDGTPNSSGVGTTVGDKHNGATSAYLSTAFQSGTVTLMLQQEIRADDYRGKRVRFSAWVKPRNVSSVSSSGIWMRVDGPGKTLAYDDMANRTIFGYGDWRLVSVVLDIPASAIGIALGAKFYAANTLLVDDMRFEVVGTEVASTNTLSAPTTSTRDSTATVAAYQLRGSFPVNLDFEGVAR